MEQLLLEILNIVEAFWFCNMNDASTLRIFKKKKRTTDRRIFLEACLNVLVLCRTDSKLSQSLNIIDTFSQDCHLDAIYN